MVGVVVRQEGASFLTLRQRAGETRFSMPILRMYGEKDKSFVFAIQNCAGGELQSVYQIWVVGLVWLGQECYA